MSQIPTDWIDGCAAAHRRLERASNLVTDSVARRSSLLDGWSVGHVLNHLARNADSHTAVFEAAGRGEVRAQYPGGPEERVQLIEQGADQPAHTLIANIRAAHERLEAAWAATSAADWAVGLGLRTYGPASLPEFVFLRWREVELHAIDLGLIDLGGPDWTSISESYLDVETQMSLRGLRARLPENTAVHVVPDDRPAYVIGPGVAPTVVRGPSRAILRWLTGRGGQEGWPVLGAW